MHKIIVRDEEGDVIDSLDLDTLLDRWLAGALDDLAEVEW